LGDRLDSQVQVDEELTTLRAKTREVEEIGMKIDEALKMCQDTETLILNTGRYNDEVFQTAKAQKFSAVKLKQLI
jgi:hypothetical protein